MTRFFLCECAHDKNQSPFALFGRLITYRQIPRWAVVSDAIQWLNDHEIEYVLMIGIAEGHWIEDHGSFCWLFHARIEDTAQAGLVRLGLPHLAVI